MKIDTVSEVTDNFLNAISGLLSRKIECQLTEKMPARIFPDVYEKIVGNRKEGVYIFSSSEDGEILYVGKSVDVVNRFWQHVGTNYQWERNGHPARFPNCALTDQRHWLDETIHKIFEKAQFDVTFLFPNHVDVKSLIEAYLICYAKPAINVDSNEMRGKSQNEAG
ncbi:MAG: GIY-YIG nuclease family protein [Syntrophales bacterium]|nr:GIY-YIG nuclease family protein [Syntrophales bacterium]